jgi:outer membrane protein TolC
MRRSLLLVLLAGAALAVPALAGAALAAPAALAAEPGSPDTSSTLTLHAAVERALARHPSMGVARAGTDEARAAKGEALAARFPSLRVSAVGTRYEDPSIVSPIHAFSPGSFPPFNETVLAGSATLSYTLFDGGARGGRIGRARALVRSSEVSLDAASQSLVWQVARTYLDVIARRQVLEAHESRLEALRAERSRVLQRFEVGRAAEVDRLRIEAAVASAEADQVQASIALDAAERDLARLIDGSQSEAAASRLLPVALADTVVAPRDSLRSQALERSAALGRSRYQAAAADAAAGAARGARWPQLKLAGTYAYYADPEGYHADEWSGALSLSYDLFTGGATTNAVRRADASRRAAREEVRRATLDLEHDLDRALALHRESRARVASLSSAVARYAEVARIQHLLVESGSGTQTDYLLAEADLLTARAGLATARADRIAARAELARVVGVLDLDWIDQHLEPEP